MSNKFLFGARTNQSSSVSSNFHPEIEIISPEKDPATCTLLFSRDNSKRNVMSPDAEAAIYAVALFP